MVVIFPTEEGIVMEPIDRVNREIAEKEHALRNLNRFIRVLSIASSVALDERVKLLDEKYSTYLSPQDFEHSPAVLEQAVRDSDFSIAAHTIISEWIQSFDSHFLPVWDVLNWGGKLPSATVEIPADGEPTNGLIHAISRFSSFVHGDTGYAIFGTVGGQFSERTNRYILVSGGKFDKAEMISLGEFIRLGRVSTPFELRDIMNSLRP